MRKSYKATAALVISALGFAGSQPYTNVFWGGLFNSGCLAAMIGGLADWFAVTALFHKPLGISYRTEILTRNRDRLMQSLVEFVGSDLLSVENIMKILGKEDMVQMILQYLDKFEGREKLKQALNRLVDAVLSEMDTKKISSELEKTIKGSLEKIDMPELCLRLLREAFQTKHSGKIIEFLAGSASCLVKDPAVQRILTENIALIKEAYTNGSSGRKMMLEMFDLSDEKLTSIFTAELDKFMENLKKPENSTHQRFQIWLSEQLAHASKSEAYRKAVRTWADDIVQNRLPIAERIEAYLNQQMKNGGGDILSSERAINVFIDTRIDQIKESAQMQSHLNEKLNLAVNDFIRARHGFVIQVIEEKLKAFSNETLVEFVETRIADDLQMIRINGSLVGALVGMFLYAMTFLAERMWG